MKKTVLLLLVVSTIFNIKAQEPEEIDIIPISQFGLKFGVNSTTLNASKNQTVGVAAASDSQFGHMAGFSYWIPITQIFRPRVELSYDVLNSDVNFTRLEKNDFTYSFTGETQLAQLSFAILPEVVFGENIQMSFFAGFQLSALVSAHEKGSAVTSDSTDMMVSTVYLDQKNNLIGEDVDSGLLAGFGARYRLSKKIYLNAETRFRFGTSMVYGIYKPYYWGLSGGVIYQL